MSALPGLFTSTPASAGTGVLLSSPAAASGATRVTFTALQTATNTAKVAAEQSVASGTSTTVPALGATVSDTLGWALASGALSSSSTVRLQGTATAQVSWQPDGTVSGAALSAALIRYDTSSSTSGTVVAVNTVTVGSPANAQTVGVPLNVDQVTVTPAQKLILALWVAGQNQSAVAARTVQINTGQNSTALAASKYDTVSVSFATSGSSSTSMVARPATRVSFATAGSSSTSMTPPRRGASTRYATTGTSTTAMTARPAARTSYATTGSSTTTMAPPRVGAPARFATSGTSSTAMTARPAVRVAFATTGASTTVMVLQRDTLPVLYALAQTSSADVGVLSSDKTTPSNTSTQAPFPALTVQTVTRRLHPNVSTTDTTPPPAVGQPIGVGVWQAAAGWLGAVVGGRRRVKTGIPFSVSLQNVGADLQQFVFTLTMAVDGVVVASQSSTAQTFAAGTAQAFRGTMVLDQQALTPSSVFAVALTVAGQNNSATTATALQVIDGADGVSFGPVSLYPQVPVAFATSGLSSTAMTIAAAPKATLAFATSGASRTTMIARPAARVAFATTGASQTSMGAKVPTRTTFATTGTSTTSMGPLRPVVRVAFATTGTSGTSWITTANQLAQLVLQSTSAGSDVRNIGASTSTPADASSEAQIPGLTAQSVSRRFHPGSTSTTAETAPAIGQPIGSGTWRAAPGFGGQLVGKRRVSGPLPFTFSVQNVGSTATQVVVTAVLAVDGTVVSSVSSGARTIGQAQSYSTAFATDGITLSPTSVVEVALFVAGQTGTATSPARLQVIDGAANDPLGPLNLYPQIVARFATTGTSTTTSQAVARPLPVTVRFATAGASSTSMVAQTPVPGGGPFVGGDEMSVPVPAATLAFATAGSSSTSMVTRLAQVVRFATSGAPVTRMAARVAQAVRFATAGQSVTTFTTRFVSKLAFATVGSSVTTLSGVTSAIRRPVVQVAFATAGVSRTIMDSVLSALPAPLNAGWCDADAIVQALLNRGSTIDRQTAALAGRVASRILAKLTRGLIRPQVTATWQTVPPTIGFGVPAGPQGRIIGGRTDYAGAALSFTGVLGVDVGSGRVSILDQAPDRDLTLPAVPGTVTAVSVGTGTGTLAALPAGAWWQTPGSPTLSRTDGGQWPSSTYGAGVVQVTMVHGGPSEDALQAAQAYAVELAQSVAGEPLEPGESVIGPRVTTMTRQGVTLQFADVSQLAPDGLTGVGLVDAWLGALRLDGGSVGAALPTSTEWVRVAP